ncbi:glycosyltransferase family 4 protein [Microbacterium mangrovi]|uniref:glycosyltransferase family 4 protein n=1 Tax=Microbacterium mangrovi TaxID=1348253 RepID=UPI0018CD5E39|nr:glycosyltransferase family 1 protein [Microbacterium mangrovi]
MTRHVGGNTTYARRIKAGLEERGIATGLMPMGVHPALTMVEETVYGSRRRSGEVVHYSADTGSLIKTRAASVVTVHGVASRWIDVARTPRQERLWRFRVQRAIRSSARVITVSQSSADDVAEVFGLDRARISVIPHGVDYEPFKERRAFSPELNRLLPSEYVLYLGNLEPRKNIEALVAAFEHPALRTLDVPLVIAGRPAWNFDAILQTIKASPHVIPLGFVSDNDRVALMQHSSLFVFPSLYEGFGMPVLEALAAGVPVACSDRGSLKEVAGPALRFEGLDSEAIAAGIHRALTDQEWRGRAATDGAEWVKRFSWSRSIEQHIAVYESVA